MALQPRKTKRQINMKVKIIILLSFLGMIVTSCTESWQLKQVHSDIFFIDLPIGSSEVEKNIDGLSYCIEYKTPTPNDQSIYVEAFPWEKRPEQAMEIVGKHSIVSNSIEHGKETDFDYNTICGIKYEGDDGRNLLKGEIFCFNKDGYTVVISSYGRYWDYRTIRDIVRSVKFGVPPMTKEQKAKAFAPVRIAKTLSVQMNNALNTYKGINHLCDSTSWHLEIDTENASNPPVIHIDNWLSPQASETLRHPTLVGAFNLRTSLASPLDYLDIPIGKSLLMSEGNLFVLRFDYYNAYGERLNISNEENNE
jgi:hypothetical protein